MSKASNPKVSVVIATFNYGRFLPDALNSVKAQSFTDWECIIVDDASTDGTAGVAQAFMQEDERFKYTRSERNAGVAAARNLGLAMAKGEYLQLLDADDVLAPEKLAVHVAFLDASPAIDLVYSDFFRFTDNPARRVEGHYRADEKTTGRPLLARLIAGNIFRLNTVLFRAHVLQGGTGFRGEFRYVEDWDFWLRIAAKGNAFAFLEEAAAVAGVRLNPGSLSSNLPTMRKYQLQVRQNLWLEGRLGLLDRFRLLLRSADFFLRMLLVHREPVVLLEKRKFGFLFWMVATALVILPFWLILNLVFRPLRRLMSKNPSGGNS